MTVLIVGLNPSGKWKRKNPTLDRLNRWMDELGIRHYSFCNVISEPGAYKKSQIDYKQLCTFTEGYDRIIALGDFVSEALSRINVDHLPMPHPSPLNRNLNCSHYEKRKIEECRRYVEGHNKSNQQHTKE